jgi:hypothetical protein
MKTNYNKKKIKKISRNYRYYQKTRENFRNCPLRNDYLLNHTTTTWNTLPTNVVFRLIESKQFLDKHIKSADGQE